MQLRNDARKIRKGGADSSNAFTYFCAVAYAIPRRFDICLMETGGVWLRSLRISS